MGDSEDEFRASRGRLKAGGPRGGRRLRRPPPPARGGEAEAPGKTQEGGEGGAPPGAGDAAAEEGGGGGRCSRRRPGQGSGQGTPEPPGLAGASAREEEEEAALRGDRSWGCRGAASQELHPGSLEEAGWVLCQICQKDLSALNSVRREQHVNRCLDEVEGPLSPPPARGPAVPECPICGKGFGSLRSRGSHLKRCAARMEVPPTLLLQAVRQQQQESLLLGPPAAQSRSKRKGASSVQRLPKKRKAAAEMDGATEDLLVAMAMSRSLEEEGKAKWLAGSRPDGTLQSRKPQRAEKKNRAKLPLLLPLLLPPDPQEARRRMEARVAQLLSEAEEEFPSTPLLPPSRLLGAELPQGAGGPCGSLWEASSLARPCPPGSFQATDFARSVSLQTPEVGVVPGVSLPSSGPGRAAEREQEPAVAALASGESRERLPCRPGDAEALQDLVELAGEGLTLTQWQLEAQRQEGPGQGWLPGDVLQSSFLQPLEKQLPQRSCPQMLPLGSLADAFRGMVNNPHLSDIQFQVDTGEVLYAHLFVLYARCPQLMEMVGCEGFLVAEEGGAGTRRLLLSDVSKEALGVFLSYLYTADISVPHHVLSEVATLARRFGVTELAGVCGGCQPGPPGVPGAEEAAGEDRAETFEELLRSMWLEEEEEALLQDRQPEEADSEEVGEQELEQIYEFAATQRKAAHDGPRVCQEAPKPRKALRESAAGRAAVEEWTGSLCPEQSQLPAAAAASFTGAPLRAGRVPQMEEEEEEENSEQHQHSAVLFPATQGDCSGLSPQSPCATEQRASAASQGPVSQGLPGLLQGPLRDLLPLGSSSPKWRAPSPGSPLALLSLVPPRLSTRGLPSPPPIGELGQPVRKKSPGPPGGRGASEGSPIVLLDSEEEAEPAEAASSLAGAAFSGPHAGALRCQPSQGGADVSRGQRPSLPYSCEAGPGKLWGAGGGSPLLLRLASNGEDSWEEASSWRVPDTPVLAKPPLVPGTEGSKGAGESPPTHSSATRLPLLGPPSAWKKPAGSPVLVMGDSEEELDSAAPWPQNGPRVPGEGSPCPSEEEGDSLLCLTANAPTPLGTPPPASAEKSPPAGSPMAGGAAAPHLGERGASTGEDSESSEVFPLTQRTPDLPFEAGRETPNAAPPTPMPLYSIMETPKLKKELRRFGVRALPKRKMILKLKEIFQYTHQGARANPQEKAAVASQPTLPHSPAQPVPRKPRLAVACSPVGKWLPGSAEPRQGARGSQTTCGFRGASGGGREGLGQVSEPHTSGRLPGTASLPTGFPPGGSTKDLAPTPSQESTASSGTGSDVSGASQSSSSMEFSSLVEEEEEEPVPASQAAAREAHKLEALRHHLGSKPALCRQILLYQPIELAGLQAELKQSGIKIAMGKLMDFLDAHCITFTTAEARREKQQHSKKRRRRF